MHVLGDSNFYSVVNQLGTKSLNRHLKKLDLMCCHFAVPHEIQTFDRSELSVDQRSDANYEKLEKKLIIDI